MSEVQSRPAPVRGGRGGARGGRGGARGSTRGRPINGTYRDSAPVQDEPEDEGELGEMKKQYSAQLPLLKELFSDWTEVDLLFALQETDGDLESTIERISEGHVSKFSDVKSAKEKSKPKPKEATFEQNSARPTRGRGGFEPSRGAPRGRGVDRGRGGVRGGRGATQSTAPALRAPAPTTSTATADSNSWCEPTATAAEAAPTGDWATDSAPVAKAAPPAEPVKPSASASDASKKTWAQMFAKPIVPSTVPIPTKPAPEAASPSEPGVTLSEISDYVEVTHEDAEPEETAPPVADETAIPETPSIIEPESPSVDLTPSRDQLTKENVEHLPDVAEPAPTGTAASTVDSSRGPDSLAPSVVGQPGAQAPIGRPPMGGFQTTAYKATAGGLRSASFNRRIAEQQEAVVMPGHHAIDKTAVQFGSLGLSGEDVDEDREELETRAQPPQHSPVAQPRASLPPVPRQQSAEAPLQESPAVTKPAPGLPPAPSQQAYPQQSPNAVASQAQSGSQAAQGYGQFSRYGQSEASAQKQYDPFGQQLPQQGGGYAGYPSHSQAPEQSSQSHAGYSSAAAPDYSSYYTADQRNTYSNYYNSYGQQSGAQDAGASQQRTGSAFGAAADSGFPSTQASQISSRYGDHNQSGGNTPNPTSGSQQHAGQPAGSQSQHPSHSQHQQGGYAGYNAHPYYNSPYYSAYMNQYSPYGQQGFGGQQQFAGKGGMHNQPQYGGYGGGYDQHSSSPGNVSGFSRDSGLGGGLGEYGRAGSAQPSQSAQSGATGFGGSNDHFGRQGGFPGQSSYGSGGQSGQQGSGDDALKPFGDSKSGPSPSALGQPGRPGSATNTGGQGAQSGLPPPQSLQQGYGGFPGHQQQGFGGTSQYGSGLGGLGGGHTAGAQHSQQGQAGYGNNSYAGGFSGSNYGSYGGRGGGGGGGWGQNYGGQH